MRRASSVCGIVATVISFAAAHAAQLERSFPETPPQRWAVFAPTHGLDAERAALVSRFLVRLVERRFPDLEFAGSRAGGLVFRSRSGVAETDLHQRLQALPGVVGATPLPTDSEVLAAYAREVARGGPSAYAAGLIVRYRDGMVRSKARRGEPMAAIQLSELSRIAQVDLASSRAMSGEAHALKAARPLTLYDAALAAKRLEMHPDIESASPDGYAVAELMPNDTNRSFQWNLFDEVSGINAQPAWDVTTGSSSLVVAVVDTGIVPHPDFGARLLPGFDFISSAANANDGDGRDSDPTDAGDWRTAGLCGAGSAAQNSSWHGTHVAGILGATGNNAFGIAGVNWQSRILPVRVLGRCGGTDSDILDGIRWAAGLPVPGVPANATPARVINSSLSGTGNCLLSKPEYQAAILEALANRSTVVVAAGNQNESALSRVPASCVGTIKVAAVGPTADKAGYSNYSRAIELAAPGGDMSRFGAPGGIYSTYASGQQSDVGGFTIEPLHGTSMAAPHVAGVATLMLSARSNLSVAQVRDIMRSTAYPFPQGSSCRSSADCGVGIVDAGEAVRLAQTVADRINFSDLWWVPEESGWGLNLQQQGDVLFGTWFTYGSNGQGIWLVMSELRRVSEDFFVGDIYQTTGVPFNLINGQAAVNQVTKVGEAVLAFFGVGINLNPGLASLDSALFYYEVGSTAGFKPIGRQIFASPTVCSFTTASRSGLQNYQDLWWNPAESGWGINLTHQGDTIFATWFTYGANGQGVWLVASDMRRTAPGTYNGRLYLTTGTPFDRINGTQSVATVTDVGQLTLTFANGESGRLDYQVGDVTGSKQIQRQVFSTPLSRCGQ